MKPWMLIGSLLLLATLTSPIPDAAVSTAAAATETYPAAILPFSARGEGLEDYGPKIADALFAALAAYPEIELVDREALETIVGEHELNLFGVVNTQQAVKIGQMVGVRLMITGSVTRFDTRLILVAKVIGTKTSKVVGASVKGKAEDDLLPLVEALGEEVVNLVNDRGAELVAAPQAKVDPVGVINRAPRAASPMKVGPVI